MIIMISQPLSHPKIAQENGILYMYARYSVWFISHLGKSQNLGSSKSALPVEIASYTCQILARCCSVPLPVSLHAKPLDYYTLENLWLLYLIIFSVHCGRILWYNEKKGNTSKFCEGREEGREGGRKGYLSID